MKYANHRDCHKVAFGSLHDDKNKEAQTSANENIYQRANQNQHGHQSSARHKSHDFSIITRIDSSREPIER
jgi:hypothetical protein